MVRRDRPTTYVFHCYLIFNLRQAFSLIALHFPKNFLRFTLDLGELFTSSLSTVVIGIFVGVVINVTHNPWNIFWNICVDARQSGISAEDAPRHDPAVNTW